MINKILIKNYAIIENANISFNSGFTVITGETGAGKSLLLGATGVVLGMRADRMMVRDSMEKAVIEATFQDASLRRVVYSKGGSRSFKNGEGISLTDLKRENKARVDFHGQHDQQFILDKSTHIEYLDRYCGHQNMVRELEELFLEISNSKSRLEQIKKNEKIKAERLDLLEFQLDEIENVNPKLGEDHDIKKRYVRMTKIKDIIQTYESAKHEISESDQCLVDKLNLICQKFASTEKYDPEISKIRKSITGILLELEEVNSSISAQLHDTTFDQEEFGILEDRMSSLESIKRKHGGSIESVLEKRCKIKDEIKELTSSDQLAESLVNSITMMEKKFSGNAIKIHKKRKKESEKLSKSILNIMSALNMKGASFDIIIEQEIDQNGFVSLDGKKILANPKGVDKVEFYLSANPGEPIKPLVSVASGGEISRIMLAIKSVFQHLDPVKTLVFDEIDAGISGKAAERVADYLKKLSKSKQVICITHLSQIIRKADHHLHLKKFVKNNKTNVEIEYLNRSESIKIIDYMFNGKTNTGT